VFRVLDEELLDHVGEPTERGIVHRSCRKTLRKDLAVG
jgi:hypothetical protein